MVAVVISIDDDDVFGPFVGLGKTAATKKGKQDEENCFHKVVILI